MKKIFNIFLLVVFLSVLVVKPVSAAGSSAILGLEGWFAGALPPPGIHFLNYTLYYQADTLMDATGEKVDISGFKLTAFADVLRPIYVSDKTIWGANPAWHLLIPVVHQNFETNNLSDSKTSIGDIYFSPLILGWHKDIYHYVASLDIIAPTSAYDANDLVNIGNNHWTFEPAFAVSAVYPNGFSASTKVMYDIHTENKDINYKTGQQIHIDYNIGYAINETVRCGIGGYYLKGLENDEAGGLELENSKEQVIAIGPSVLWKTGNAWAVLKAQFEMESKNRPEGTAIWLRIIYTIK